MSTIKFFSTKKEYQELSNFYKTEILYKNIVWKSAEHAFQASKFFTEDGNIPHYESHERKLIRMIMDCNTPNFAKILGNQKLNNRKIPKDDLDFYNNNRSIITESLKYSKIRKNWDDIKVSIMREIVMNKFHQNADLYKLLKSTKSKKLIEDSPYDEFWGRGKHGDGKNMLGKILENIRDLKL